MLAMQPDMIHEGAANRSLRAGRGLMSRDGFKLGAASGFTLLTYWRRCNGRNPCP
jgi:hypothetical protein